MGRGTSGLGLAARDKARKRIQRVAFCVDDEGIFYDAETQRVARGGGIGEGISGVAPAVAGISKANARVVRQRAVQSFVLFERSHTEDVCAVRSMAGISVLEGGFSRLSGVARKFKTVEMIRRARGSGRK